MVQFTFMNIHEYSKYKTGIIREYSRIYTMNIHEFFKNIHELFMVKKAGNATRNKSFFTKNYHDYKRFCLVH